MDSKAAPLSKEQRDSAELSALRAVAEAASDYKLSKVDKRFAAMNGGVRKLESDLFEATQQWEDYLDSQGSDS